MYERRSARLLPRKKFAARMLGHFTASMALVVVSLLLGMAGYHHFQGLGASDAFLDAAMILGGMGPVHAPVTTGGKLFAGLYALYSGLVFLVAAGVLLVPVLHRLLHHFHWEETADQT